MVRFDVMDEPARLAFRRALGAFPTGVALVAARGEGGKAGVITVNSFTSVSLDPPLVLWCLGDASDRYSLFAKAQRFGVTICSADQAALAARFAGRDRDDAMLSEVQTLHDCPVVRGGLVRFACETDARHHAGDHLIIIGRVIAMETDDGDALTYFRGRFGAASSET